MLQLVFTIFALSSTLVYAYDGVQCGDFKCINDPNVVCNTETMSCECAPGYAGNGRVMCALDTEHICTAMGDPHIVTFNNEVSKILIPCQNILTYMEVPLPPSTVRLLVRVTAIVETSYFARYPAQVVVVGLYVEFYLTGEAVEHNVYLRCNDVGCLNNDTSELVTDYEKPGSNLIFNVTRNVNNQQIIKVPAYDVEIRFRGEDGSVAIKVPTQAVIDMDSGLCNNFIDPPTFNSDEQAREGYSTLDNYLLFNNGADIPTPQFEDDATCRKLSVFCDPYTRTVDSIEACSPIYNDIPFSECYYNYRNKNANQVLADFELCRENMCDNLTPTTLCNLIAASGCALPTSNTLGCP